MEGDYFLRRLSQYHADYSIGENNPAFGRNYQQPQVNSNHRYNGVLYGNPSVYRQIGWQIRNIGEAAFMSPSGSDEETYFNNEMDHPDSAVKWLVDYKTYKGANFNNFFMGAVRDDSSYPISNLGVPFGSSFMASYNNMSWNFVALLNPDMPDLKTVADNVANQAIAMLVGGAFNGCTYFGDDYNPGTSLNNQGTTAPGTYISSAADIGASHETKFDFDSATGNITVKLQNGTPSNGWCPPSGDPCFPFLAGDLYRPFSSDSDGGGNVPPPSPAVEGFDYCVVNVPSPTQIQVSTTCGGAPITSWGSSVAGVGGTMVPGNTGAAASRTCPPTNSWVEGTGSPNVYWQWIRMGVCMAALRNVPNAGAACAANKARSTVVPTGGWNLTAEWGIDSSP